MLASAAKLGKFMSLGRQRHVLEFVTSAGRVEFAMTVVYPGVVKDGELLGTPLDLRWTSNLRNAPAKLGELFLPGCASVVDAPVQWNPRSADGRYPVVFFLHGGETSPLLSLELLEGMASEGFLVVAADELGSNFSACDQNLKTAGGTKSTLDSALFVKKLLGGDTKSDSGSTGRDEAVLASYANQEFITAFRKHVNLSRQTGGGYAIVGHSRSGPIAAGFPMCADQRLTISISPCWGFVKNIWPQIDDADLAGFQFSEGHDGSASNTTTSAEFPSFLHIWSENDYPICKGQGTGPDLARWLLNGDLLSKMAGGGAGLLDNSFLHSVKVLGAEHMLPCPAAYRWAFAGEELQESRLQFLNSLPQHSGVPYPSTTGEEMRRALSALDVLLEIVCEALRAAFSEDRAGRKEMVARCLEEIQGHGQIEYETLSWKEPGGN